MKLRYQFQCNVSKLISISNLVPVFQKVCSGGSGSRYDTMLLFIRFHYSFKFKFLILVTLHIII